MQNTTVIVRSFGGNPLLRVAIQAENGLIYVVKPGTESRVESGETSAVGFPETDIFEYENEVFDRLRQEWQAGGTTERATWAALSRPRLPFVTRPVMPCG
jgi:hypothetical protein